MRQIRCPIWLLACGALIAGCPGAAALPSATALVGPAGGTLSAQDSNGTIASVQIPAGALSTSTQITLTPDPTPVGPAGVTLLGPSYVLGPESLKFKKPVTMTLQFTPPELPSGASPSVAIYSAPTDSTTFTDLHGTIKAPTQIAARTSHAWRFVSGGGNCGSPDPKAMCTDAGAASDGGTGGDQATGTDDGGSPSSGSSNELDPCHNSALDGGGDLVTLASGQDQPGAIAVDATHVYWLTSTAVVSVPISGGAVKTLASGQAYPQVIAVNSTGVYWTNAGADAGPYEDLEDLEDGTVMTVPIEGGTPTTLASGLIGPNGIAVDETSVYWSCALWVDGGIDFVTMSVPVQGGTPAILSSGELLGYWDGITTDSTSVYWTTDDESEMWGGTVMSGPLDGGISSVLATGQFWPGPLAVDATSVYWTDNGTGNGAVMSVARGGGTPTTLTTGAGYPVSIAVDATHVYWVEGEMDDGGVMATAAVMSVPLGGGTPAVLAQGQSAAGLAVDATSVYWTDYLSGTIMKLTPKTSSLCELATGPAGGTSDGGEESLTVLASALDSTGHLAVAETNVYWATRAGAVLSVPLAGGSLLTLASAGPCGGIAADATSVYWSDCGGNGALLSVPIGGGSVTTLVPETSGQPMAVAVDATNVYWADGVSAVLSVPIAGGSPTPLATGQSYPSSIAVDSTSVYWTNEGDYSSSNGTVMSAPLAGGSPVTLASGQSDPQAIAIDATRVYWANLGDVESGCCNGSVVSVPLAGGAPTTLAWEQVSPMGIAVDSTSVYWTTFAGLEFTTEWEILGTVMSVPLAGGSPATLAAGQDFPLGIAADATSLYWVTETDGCIGLGANYAKVMKLTPK